MPVIDAADAASVPEVEDTGSMSQPSDRRDSRPSQDHRRSEPRHHDDRRNAPRSGGGDRVVGMGDHVPDFILRSFRVANTVAEVAEDEISESQS